MSQMDYRRIPAYKRDPHDFYVEPAWCVEALLGAVRFVGSVWDPACGTGTIPNVCLAQGMRPVYHSDLIKRYVDKHDQWDSLLVGTIPGYQERPESFDFLDDDPEDNQIVDNIICNPPYRHAEAFILRALAIARFKVAMLLQEKFLYSQRRHALFTRTPVARVLHFSTRPSMPPGEALAEGRVDAKGGRINYVWIVWDHDHQGPPTCGWLLKPHSSAMKGFVDGR